MSNPPSGPVPSLDVSQLVVRPPHTPSQAEAKPSAKFGDTICDVCHRALHEHGSKDCRGNLIENLKELSVEEARKRL